MSLTKSVLIAVFLFLSVANSIAECASVSEDELLRKGNALLQSRSFNQAIIQFSSAIAQNPQSAKAFFLRGLAYYNRGDARRALADFDKVVELDAGFIDAYNGRGVVYASLGMRKRALEEYSKVIDRAPTYPFVYNNRGVMYREMGNIDAAIADFSKAIDLNSRYGVAWKNRALAYYAKKDFASSKRDAAKAEELGQSMPDGFSASLDRNAVMVMCKDMFGGVLGTIAHNKKGGIMAVTFLCIIGLVVIFFTGIRIVRPTHRGIVERFGKYKGFAEPGFHWIIPVVDKMYQVNVTEQMIDASPQEIITNDNLNARVDAQVYFKVCSDEKSVKSSQYNVNNYVSQIVNLARTTLRNIIGTLTLKSANSERGKINAELHKTLREETASWGLEIVRTELKEIDPPKDVQETMNKVVKAENEKIAAIDFATATETTADGARRAEIKKAEGIKQAKILAAQGEAEAIKLVNEAAEEYFVGNAQVLRRLEALETALKNNAKIIVPSDKELVNVIGEMAGIIPLKVKEGQEK